MTESKEKENKKNIKEIIEKYGHCAIVNVVDSAERKIWHIWAEENKLAHLSYRDKKYKSEYSCRYWCKKCNEWRDKLRGCTRYNCCDDGTCTDYTIYCNKCETDDDKTVLWTQDAHEYSEYKRKAFDKSNCILITNDNDLRSDKNKKLFKEYGITYRNACRQWKKQKGKK